MNTQSAMHNRDDNASIRELLLRRHAVLRSRFQTLQRGAGPMEIDSDGTILSGGEEVQAAAREVSRSRSGRSQESSDNKRYRALSSISQSASDAIRPSRCCAVVPKETPS